MIRKQSKTNKVHLSNGKSISRAIFDGNVRNAARIFKFNCADEGNPHCKDCGTSSALTASHIVSKKKCVEEGKAECAWDLNNLELLCMGCHLKYESYKDMNDERIEYIEYFNNLKKK